MGLNPFYSIFGDFGPPFWTSGATKNQRIHDKFAFVCPEGSLDRFGTTFCFILGPCRGYFGIIFGGFSKIFGVVSDLC